MAFWHKKIINLYDLTANEQESLKNKFYALVPNYEIAYNAAYNAAIEFAKSPTSQFFLNHSETLETLIIEFIKGAKQVFSEFLGNKYNFDNFIKVIEHRHINSEMSAETYQKLYGYGSFKADDIEQFRSITMAVFPMIGKQLLTNPLKDKLHEFEEIKRLLLLEYKGEEQFSNIFSGHGNNFHTHTLFNKTGNEFSIIHFYKKQIAILKAKGLDTNKQKGFATLEQIDKIFSTEKGFYIGGGKHFTGDGHMLTVGGSGAGKGVNFIIPALLSPALTASGSSVVVLDPKGENLAICGEHLKRNGYKVLAINPFSIPEIMGFGKISFNPFSLTSKNDINAPTFCDLIAECLISDDNKNDHWNDSARQYISLYLLYMVATDQANFKNLFEAVRLGGVDRLEYLEEMKNCKAFDGIISATAGGIAMQMMASKDANSGEIDSIFSAVRRGTEKFKNLELREHLSHSDFDLKTIAQEKTALFVCVNPSELKEYSAWLRVLFGCMFNTLKKHYNTKRRVLFLMDEFPQIGRLKEFQTAMVYMRGYNATLWVIVQNLGQLKELYWDSWESFVGSASVKMWLPLGADNFTIDYLENRLPVVDEKIIKGFSLETERRKTMTKFELIVCEDAIIEARGLGNFAKFEKIPYWSLAWGKNASPNPFRE